MKKTNFVSVLCISPSPVHVSMIVYGRRGGVARGKNYSNLVSNTGGIFHLCSPAVVLSAMFSLSRYLKGQVRQNVERNYGRTVK